MPGPAGGSVMPQKDNAGPGRVMFVGVIAQLRSTLKSLRDARRSVRGKLVAVVLLTTIVVLLVSSVAFLGHDFATYRSSWAEDVATEANILSLSTAPAMAFDDRKVATRNLASLQARPSVLAAALYSPDGELYAAYARPDEQAPPARLPMRAEGVMIDGQKVEILQRVVYNEEYLGVLYLQARYELMDRVRAYFGIVVFVTVLSLLLALSLSAFLQRAITVPLEAIAEVAGQIVNRQDYSLRVEKTTEDETGVVVQALNRMLDEVQTRTQALEQSNASLLDEVAERQAARAALARANARLESTMAAAEIGGWVRDFKTGELVVDRNFAELLGASDEVALSRDTEGRRKLIHPDDRPGWEAAKAEALVTGTLASTEARIIQPDGSLRWVIARGKVQFDADGSPLRLAGLLIDVTAQKKAEQARRDNERVYRAIGESIDFGIWLTDAAGRNTYASESFLRLTGMTQAQCSEFGWGSVLHPEDADATMAAWQACASSGNVWYREHRVRGVDGHYHAILAQGLPIRDDDGRIQAWAGINLDISRLKRTEEALREADRRKDEFLATLAHELRNPLAPIRNAAEVVGSAQATAAQRQWGHEVIGRQVRNMALLLDDLLDVSRITRGRLELKKSIVVLADLVAAAVETAQPLISARQHQLRVLLPPEPVQLNVDPLRLSQMLSNLLTNAAKYTPSGGLIVVSAELDDSGVRVAVRDNGIGLSKAAIATVFDMFSQIESALERSQGGLGIGLALARGLALLHDGSLEAASDGEGCGSMFTIRLPAAAIARQAPQAIGSPAGSGTAIASRGTIVVADDNHDAADSLATLLGFHGYEVQVAYSGQEVLNLAGRQCPDLFILDIGMPPLSGYEVARAIRRECWGSAAKLIALTGWGQRDDIERAKAAGFDHHFRKPVDIDKLIATLSGLLAERGQPGPEPR